EWYHCGIDHFTRFLCNDGRLFRRPYTPSHRSDCKCDWSCTVYCRIECHSSGRRRFNLLEIGCTATRVRMQSDECMYENRFRSAGCDCRLGFIHGWLYSRGECTARQCNYCNEVNADILPFPDSNNSHAYHFYAEL